MIKLLASLALGASLSAVASTPKNPCPRLSGHFWCMIGPEELSELVVKQKTSGDVTTYSFDYLAIPGEPDVFQASAKGAKPDEFGYVTRCEDGKRLVSGALFDPNLSEIFINYDRELERRYGGVTQMKCPRKSRSR